MEEYIRTPRGKTRSIELVWASRKSAFIHDLCEGELKPALGHGDIRTNFFSTSIVHSRSALSESASDNSGLSINQGRPDVTGFILAAAKTNIEGGSKAGHLAVLVCGPAGMADEARTAVHRAMNEGCRNIEYVEETFGW